MAVHIYTQTIHRTTQITTNVEECGHLHLKLLYLHNIQIRYSKHFQGHCCKQKQIIRLYVSPTLVLSFHQFTCYRHTSTDLHCLSDCETRSTLFQLIFPHWVTWWGLKWSRFDQIITECHDLPHTTTDIYFKSNDQSSLNLFLLGKSMTEIWHAWGGVVVKALRYYSEGSGIDPRSLGIFFGP